MTQTVDFVAIDSDLQQMCVSLSAAEIHGMMCGIICADQQRGDQQRWQQLVFADKEVPEALTSLFEQSHEQLLADEFDFQLVLPADSESIERRTEALADWNQGFLSGLGLAGLKKNIDPEVKATLNDLIEICKVYCEQGIAAEGHELSYTELVEYVRMAVIFIFTELHMSDKPVPKK